MDLILIAGLPATGKSSFADFARKALGIPLVSKDTIKELLFDTVGFRSHDEKTALNIASLNIMYYFAECLLEQGQSVILENNFENYAKPKLYEIVDRYQCNVITVFFGGDSSVIYSRYVSRNADPHRHRGHVLSTEYPERENIGHIPSPISYEDFLYSFKERGMADPPIEGKCIFVDTTELAKVDFDAILAKLQQERCSHS